MKLRFFDVWIRVLQTLIFWRLEFVDRAYFNVKNKRSISFKSGGIQYFFEVESQDQSYSSTIQVFAKEYNRYKKGLAYKELGVIRSKTNDQYILLTKHTKAEGTILKEWVKALLMTLMMVTLCLLVITGLLAIAILIYTIVGQVMSSMRN